MQDDYPRLGDWVLIHVGFAMSKISEADALDQMRMLTALGEKEAALQEVQGYDFGDSPPANDRSEGPGRACRLAPTTSGETSEGDRCDL